MRLRLSWVTPDLAVGAAPVRRREAGRLLRENVQAMLDLRTPSEKAGGTHVELEVKELEVEEFRAPAPSQLHEATTWVAEQRSRGRTVLVCCREGRGRSVTVAIAVLMDRGFSLAEAHRRVLMARPHIAPSVEQLRALQALIERA